MVNAAGHDRVADDVDGRPQRHESAPTLAPALADHHDPVGRQLRGHALRSRCELVTDVAAIDATRGQRADLKRRAAQPCQQLDVALGREPRAERRRPGSAP